MRTTVFNLEVLTNVELTLVISYGYPCGCYAGTLSLESFGGVRCRNRCIAGIFNVFLSSFLGVSLVTLEKKVRNRGPASPGLWNFAGQVREIVLLNSSLLVCRSPGHVGTLSSGRCCTGHGFSAFNRPSMLGQRRGSNPWLGQAGKASRRLQKDTY